jgi:protein-disulfide isomerase
MEKLKWKGLSLQGMRMKTFALFFVLLLIPALARAQKPASADLNQRIERQVRAYTEAPPNAQVTIGARTPSNFAGYDNLSVTIEANGIRKPVNFLIAKDGSKLLYLTEIDLREDPYAANMHKIDTRGRPFRGAENGPVTLVVYDDFECPFCSRMYVTLMNEVMTRYRDRVKIVMKDFPILDAHPWAMRAAVDAHCLADQNLAAYWEFSDYVHTHQQEVSAKVIKAPGQIDATAMDGIAKDSGVKHQVNPEALQACIAAQDQSRVNTSIAEGKSLGVSATPTMFVNGQEVEGMLTAENLRLMLDHALAESGSKAP